MINYDKVPELADSSPPSAARRWLLLLGVSGLVLAGGAAAYWWWGPVAQRERGGAAMRVPRPAEKIAQLENRLQEIAGSLVQLDSRGTTQAVRDLLNEAVAQQTELMSLRAEPRPEDAARLQAWRGQLADLDALGWLRLSEQAEEAALRAAPAQAVEKLTEAWQWQQQINRSSARMELKNTAREVRLLRLIERLGVNPRLDEAMRRLEAARAAVAAEQWAEAQAGYTAAQELYQQIDRDFPQSALVPRVLTEEVAAGLATVRAAQADTAVTARLQLAAEAAAAGKTDLADAHYVAAAALQKRLNEDFPRSALVSMERIAGIETARQTMRARAMIDVVSGLDRQATEHRRRRENFQSQQLLTEIVTKLEGLRAAFPQAAGLAEDLRRRVTFLVGREAEIEAMQDQVYALLRPLPHGGARAMLRTEVPQSLYGLVMKQNPSRHAGAEFPAESMTRGEAEEFCQRLSWVMGAPVRLPTREEFKLAVGNPAESEGWGAENSAGQSQRAAQKPANAAGFHDLLGNVAEWVAGADADQVSAMGGSYAESRAQLLALSVRSVPKNTRAPSIGFRVVVELDLQSLSVR